MKFKKSTLALLLLVFSTTACNVNIISEKVSPITKLTKAYRDYTVTKVSSSEYIIDLAGKNKNLVTGNKVSVNISDVDNNFKTKASTDGLPAQTKANVKSYLVNLCTDPTQPLSTSLLVDVPINRDSTNLVGNVHTLTFSNLPPNSGLPYYAMVQAFDQPVGMGGNSIIKADNGNSVSPYISPDTGLEIAVSTNFVTINPDFTYTFSSGTELDITANLKDSSPPLIDSTVEPINGKYGVFSMPDSRVDQAPGSTNQSFPSVSINNSGNGLVVWKDERASTKSVYGRFINDYVADGNEFLISSRGDTTIGDIFNPNVSLNNNGNGFVVWEETIPDTLVSQPANHIYLEPVFNYKMAGSRTSVDFGLTGNQQSQSKPKVTLNTGVGLVSWYGDSDPTVATNNRVYIRGLTSFTFNNTSNYSFTPASSSILLTPSVLAGQQINVSSSNITSSGSVMLVWQDSRSGNYDIYAEQVNVSPFTGVGTSTEFLVNQSTTGDQEAPSVSINDAGDGLVVWQDASSGNYNIHARKISGYSVNTSNSEFVVTSAVGDQKNPNVSLDSNGNGLITWDDGRTGVSGTSDIYGIQVKNFSLVGTEFKIDSDTTQKQQNSVVSVNSNSNGMVTWQDYRDYTSTPTIYARRVANSITQ